MFISSLMVACVKTEKEVRYLPAPGQISQSFSRTDSCQKHFCVDLKKSSLNKKFLLLTTAKTSSIVPQWEDFKPYSVVFERKGNKVAMLAFAPLTILEQDSQLELLQTFDVLDDSGDFITIDWSNGFSSIRFESNYEDDGPQMEDNPSKRSSAQVIDAFVRNVSIQDDFVEIQQNSKLLYSVIKNRRADFFEKDSPKLPEFETQETSLLVNMRLYPDVERQQFAVKRADDDRQFGFFTYGRAIEGIADQQERMIMKWDIDPARGPVTYYISAQTPAEYVEAVKQGVLYWNRVFGRTVFTVVAGVEANFIPPMRSVMIRWLPWHDAGFAYANIQAHPMTGEILRGQIYMTTAFTQTEGLKDRLQPIFKPLASCPLAPKFTQLKQLRTSRAEATTQVDQNLAHDSVMETIAHEVGHTVGLRHNFGASYFAKPDNYKMFEEVKRYLKGEVIQGFESVASVMDYVGGAQHLVMANFIKNNALTYDKLAIEWAYLNANVTSSELLAGQTKEVQNNFIYCDDDDLALAEYRDKKSIFECERFDPAGNYFVAYTHSHLKNRNLILAEHFEDLTAELMGRAAHFDMERFLANQEVKIDIEMLNELMQVANKKSKMVSYSFFKEVLKQEYKKGEDKEIQTLVANQLQQAGGLTKLNALICPTSNAWIVDQLAAVLEQIEQGKGSTKGGQEFEYSEAQKQMLGAYFQKLTEQLQVSYLESLQTAGFCKAN